MALKVVGRVIVVCWLKPFTWHGSWIARLRFWKVEILFLFCFLSTLSVFCLLLVRFDTFASFGMK